MEQIKILDKVEVVRKLPENFKDNDLRYFEHELKRTFSEVFMFMLDNCTVYEELLIKQGKFRVVVWNNRSKKRRIFYYIKTLFKRAKNINEDHDKLFCWIVDDWSSGYFHWFCDVVPKIIFTIKRGMDCVFLLPNEIHKRAYIKESLKRLRVKFLTFDGGLKLKKLIYIPNLAPSGNYRLEFIRPIKKLLVSQHKEGSAPFRKIYISRENTGYRKVVNEKEFVNLIKKYGFEVYYFEELNWQQQVKLAQESKVILSPHGAGLTNMLFMEKGTNVIELRRINNTHNNCYFALANALSIKYF